MSNRFETLHALDNIDTIRETITEMIQQSESRETESINKSHKSRISSTAPVLKAKRNKFVRNGDNKQRIEYVKICKTIKKKARHQRASRKSGECRC